ncbi:hypothetical protein K438DRAFT_1774047 [Mycena galopus ATCC 62051]|nr:hypothetical protein K438DRAFT_1774047 [Mycena galopus ATCC 62051]
MLPKEECKEAKENFPTAASDDFEPSDYEPAKEAQRRQRTPQLTIYILAVSDANNSDEPEVIVVHKPAKKKSTQDEQDKEIMSMVLVLFPDFVNKDFLHLIVDSDANSNSEKPAKKIKKALEVENTSIDKYNVTFTVPCQVTEPILLMDNTKYQHLVDNTLNIKSEPNVKIVTELKLISKTKENDDDNDGAGGGSNSMKGKRRKVRSPLRNDQFNFNFPPEFIGSFHPPAPNNIADVQPANVPVMLIPNGAAAGLSLMISACNMVLMTIFSAHF